MVGSIMTARTTEASRMPEAEVPAAEEVPHEWDLL